MTVDFTLFEEFLNLKLDTFEERKTDDFKGKHYDNCNRDEDKIVSLSS